MCSLTPSQWVRGLTCLYDPGVAPGTLTAVIHSHYIDLISLSAGQATNVARRPGCVTRHSVAQVAIGNSHVRDRATGSRPGDRGGVRVA